MKKILFSLLFLLPFVVLSQDFNMQNGNISLTCGDSPTFFDTGGGGAGQYSNNENLVLTICPSSPGERVQLDFTSFGLQNGSDFMDIFDGDDTTAPLLGTYTGTASPGLVVASGTNPTGCLTIRFVSDNAGVNIGWQATVTCACQEIIANVDSTVPSFDASNIVNADIAETITFNGSGTFSSDGTGATYTWDFGDGTPTVNGQTVTHDYPTAGVYVVTLTITDAEGCQNTNTVDLRVIVGASTPGNPFVDAGNDVSLDCTSSGCTDITAEFLDIGETNTYRIDQIPFVPPFNFSGLTNSLNPNADDRWSSVENLPFDFCFFANTETQFQIGSNGVVRFDVDPADTGSGYAFSEDLPNNTNNVLGDGNVFLPIHDIDPTQSNSEEIAWEIIGTAPNRVLAVSYFEVPMFSGACNSLLATHMVVFYETTNVIDIYIKDKPSCDTWQGGASALGIQNDAGTTAFVPPGRNTSDSPWVTNDEAWRFTPAGTSVVDFAWLDSAGNIVGTTPTINVCPTSTEVYTARVVYTNCNGDTVTVTDDVTVEILGDFVVDLGPDQNLCDTSTGDVTLDADIGSATATYQWALDGTDIAGATNPTFVVTGMTGGTYSVLVNDNGCDIGDSVIITYGAGPAVIQPTDMVECDDAANDGTEIFDLTTQIPQILGTQDPTLFNVTFHPTLADADANTAAIASPDTYVNGTSPETIFVRVTEISSGCFSTTQFDIIVNTQPIANALADITVCDDDLNDGTEPFDLDAIDIQVLGTQDAALFSVTYYPTQADADAGTNALTSPYNSDSTVNCEQIYVRIENNANTDCYDTTSFEICVDYQPTAVQPADIVECDDASNDGIEMFDFTTQVATIIGTQNMADVDVTFHPTQGDADANTGALPNTYTGPTTTIYVRVSSTDITNLCYATTSFQVRVVPVPIANPVADITVCDDDLNDGTEPFDLDAIDIQVLGTQDAALFSVTYYPTQADADAGTNALTSPYNSDSTVNCEQIYVRIENNANTDCYDTTNFEICVDYQPTAVQPNNIVVCDDASNDGIEMFDFTTQIATIIGTQNMADVDVTFHPTQGDADANTGAIPNTYTGPTTTIYVRVSSTDVMNLCYATTSFQVRVDEVPVANPVADITVCDDDLNDGTESFDLDAIDIQVLGTQDAALFSVTYYPTQADADAGTNALTSPYNSDSTVNCEQIYVRIENNANTDCYATTNFEICVDYQPTAVQPNNIVVCDDASNDGIEMFDLTTQIATIIGTQNMADVDVTFHPTQGDADANTAAFANTYTGPTTTIYVRVSSTDVNNICYTTTSFEVRVNPLPIAVMLTPLEECDDDTDGFIEFMLTDADAEIIAGQTSTDPMVITYYDNEPDAIAGTGTPLTSSYTNTTANMQTVYVRIVNTVTGCSNTTMLNLQVNSGILATTPTNYSVCDDTNGDDTDGLGTFDLSTKDAEILGALAGTATVTYYTNQLAAETEDPAFEIIGLYTAASLETVYARVEDNITGCYDVVELILLVDPLPNLDNIPPMIACDVNNTGDMMEMFDLTTHTTVVENGQVGLTITYYLTQADADADTGAITNVNGTDGDFIWVRAVNPLGCFQTGSFELQVPPLPIFVAPTTLEACDDETADGIAPTDLTVKNDEITISNPDLSVSYHLTQADADGDVNALVMPYENTATPTNYSVSVRVEDINTGCYIVTQLTVNINDTPAVFPATPLEYCDTDNDGFGIFDIRSTESQITGGIIPGQVTVTYHETPEDADNGVNPLPDTYTNINAENQTIYVRVENVLTGCFNVVPLDLIVNDAPEIAALDAATLEECDTDTDGIAQFDLTQSAADILNGEDPLTHTIRYYNTQVNANLGTAAGEINNVNAYSNISLNTQTIWVRVDDLATGCFRVTNLTLIVNELPTLVQLPGLEACDAVSLNDGIEIFDLSSLSEQLLNNAPGISLNYYANAADLASNTPIATPDMYSNTEIGVQTIFVLATNDTTGCQNTITFNITVNPLPSPTLDPNGLLVADICDEDNDGFQLFDLDGLVNDIINNEPDVVYSFHETLSDAENNLNALVSPYTNIMMDSQTIYVLATNTITGCFTITPLQLTVTPIPVLPLILTDLEECDEASSLDGIDMFDLTQTQTEIYGSQTPSDFTLTYHESQQDAQDDVNPIVNLTDYTNIVANQQTIWVRLEDNTTACFAIGSFDILVVPPPVVVQPLPFSLCDDLESGDNSDELTSFDLTDKYTEITAGDTSLTLAYYANAADLASDTPIVDPTTYQNVTNPQVIYIRATNTAGCTTDITMTLRVLPIPTPNTMPEPLTDCDDDTDGILVFDLTLSEAEIVDNENNVTVSYHTTETDAMDATNPIADPTMHTVDMTTANANGQVIIYVRVQSDLQIDSNMLPCYTIVELPVIVHPLPVLNSMTFEYVFCEYDSDDVGQFDWDVVSASLDLLEAPQDLADFTVTYHPTVADALAGTAALANGFENTTDPQTVFIRVENTATQCINSNNIASVELSVEPIPTATTPGTFAVCAADETDQDTGIFDLTSLDAGIINGQTDMEVVYYETATDADMDINAITATTNYVNTSNPQILFVRVRQTITGCLSDTILLTLQVNPVPVFTLPADDVLCVDATTGQALDIRTIGVDFGAGYSYQWTTPTGTATTATIEVTQAGTYSVIVTDMNNTTNCTYDDSVSYTASSAPSALDIAVNTPAFADLHNVTATASGGSGSYEYQLDDGQWQTDGIFTDITPGEHTITVRDTNGCGEIVRTFGLIDFMEFFTPNGDAFNPTWNIIGLKNQPSAKIFIFDRYGKLLKQISPAGPGWDGTFNGNIMPSADYWFRVEYVDPFDGTPKEFINHFTLKR